MKKAAFINLGCRENLLDGALMADFFKQNGWEVIAEVEEADYIVVNSCGFAKFAEQDSMKAYYRAVASKRDGARIIFAGCLPAINKQLIRSEGYDGVMVTPRTLGRLNELIEASIPIESLQVRDLAFDPDAVGLKGLALSFTQRAAAFLKGVPFFPMPRWFWQAFYLPTGKTEYIRISIGCMGRCAFCAIRRAKGSMKSVPLGIVLARFKDALRRGKKSIAFSCDELGGYGQEMGIDIATLLEEITAIPGDYHLILRNTEPEWIIKYWERLKPIFASGKIGYVIMPLQTGNDKIMRLMRRSYTTEEYLWLVKEIRRHAPKVLIRSHIMVGFPGETEEDFEETCNYIKELPIDHFKVHMYTERPFIPSAKLPGQVPKEAVEKRFKRMLRLNLLCQLKAYRWFPLRP